MTTNLQRYILNVGPIFVSSCTYYSRQAFDQTGAWLPAIMKRILPLYPGSNLDHLRFADKQVTD